MPLDLDATDLQRLHRQALRRQNVAHLRRTYPEREGAERAVRRGVTVAADDRHARLRQTELGPDHMDDALGATAEVEKADARLAHVALESRQHVFGHHVHERPPLIARRNDVIDRRDRALRKPDLPPARAQHVERLRGSDLVDQVQADEQLRLPVGQFADGVEIPDFLEERRGHGEW